MSMFENKTKPELERGNFIAYADEPGTIVSPGSGGGGGGAVQTLNAHYNSDTEAYELDTVVTFNELKAAFDAGTEVHLEMLEEGSGYTTTNVARMQSLESYQSDSSPSYKVQFLMGSTLMELSAESPDTPMTMS